MAFILSIWELLKTQNRVGERLNRLIMKLQELNVDELKYVNGGLTMLPPPDSQTTAPGNPQAVDGTTTPVMEDETNMFTATVNMLHSFRLRA